jgi:hypothetical protein
MATVVGARPVAARGDGFFVSVAAAMTLVLVAGFSLQLGAGRSSFAAPWPVHLHGVLFFGWTFYFLFQTVLAASGRGSVALHRRLGWLAALMVPAMVAMGTAVTVLMVQAGRVPFIFPPLYFLVMNPLSVLTFAGLVAAAVSMRRRTQWHRRLMVCAMAVLTGPGWGRLLPVPLMVPHVAWSVWVAVMLFPLAGMVRDWRRDGRVHPAWLWGAGAILAAQVMMDLIAGSAAGAALYAAVTTGTPGAALAPMAYPPFPS